MPSSTSDPLPGLPSRPLGQATWSSNRSRSSAFMESTWMNVSAPGNSGELMNSTGVLRMRLLVDFAEDRNAELPQHLPALEHQPAAHVAQRREEDRQRRAADDAGQQDERLLRLDRPAREL